MHCGMLVQFGPSAYLQCDECDQVCHEDCQLCIPNYCGLTAAMAETLLTPRDEQPLLRSLDLAAAKSTLHHYELLSVIGKGNFGKVVLAHDRQSSRLVAIKMLRMDSVIDNDELDSVHAERQAFLVATRSSFPFLVQCYACFQDESRLYFVMEYVAGGDLMFHVQHRKFSLDEARFYAAEVLLALEHLHRHGIIYRDLKLDNILLGADGHVRLADYGLCKTGMQWHTTTQTFCGTPEFMAPEILLEQPYTWAVDWWAFGVLVYELVLGQAPFHGHGEAEVFDSILANRVRCPLMMDADARDLVQRVGCGWLCISVVAGQGAEAAAGRGPV